MFVSCSTRCFSKEPLEAAIRHIAELEFTKLDLAIVENSHHIKPSEVEENLDAVYHRVRRAPSLTPCVLDLEFGDVEDTVLLRRFEAICRLAKPLTVAVLTLQASPMGTSLDEEVRRLGKICDIAFRAGLVPTLLTHSKALTADPATAVALCKAIPGLGLTLDPSHYIQGPLQGASYDEIFPYVKHVQFRDTGRNPGAFQVRVGQGEIEYGRIVNQLERQGYDRALSVAFHDTIESPFDVEIEVRKLKLLLESQT